MDVFGFTRAAYVGIAFALILLSLGLWMLHRGGPPKDGGAATLFVVFMVVGAGLLAGLGWLVLMIGRA